MGTVIRTVLGHGSGFDSPGFNRLRASAPALDQAFGAVVRGRSLSLDDLYRERRAHPELYALAEALMSFDEGMIQWRVHHLKVVERIIGGNVIGPRARPWSCWPGSSATRCSRSCGKCAIA